MPHPQQNWVVKNLKLDSNETNRRGYVQKGVDGFGLRSGRGFFSLI